MKGFRRPKVSHFPGLFLAAVVAAGAGLPAGSSAAPLRPTGDIVERFGANPLVPDPQGKLPWFASGGWSWEARGTTLSSDGPLSSMLWTPGSHFTGALKLRFRLGGAQSRARLLFAHDPVTGAHRWVEVAAGHPGRVTLGQTGTIRGSTARTGVIQVWRPSFAAGAWQDLALTIAADKSVTVSLGGTTLFTAAAAPLAPGLVGFGSAAGPVSFDEFSFAANPDGEPCIECHAGQPDQPLAADVYAWWDGRRWDALYPTDPDGSVQQGGHGDPNGEAALGCAGANGCHDMRLPRPEDHRNGFREGRGRRTVNSFHLRSAAIVAEPRNPWDVQLTLDDFCYAQCHQPLRLKDHRHNSDSDVDPAPLVVMLGEQGTKKFGETIPLPVDSDISTRALVSAPDFAPCVSCHDPHGTGTTDNKGDRNMMLRLGWVATSALCNACHV